MTKTQIAYIVAMLVVVGVATITGHGYLALAYITYRALSSFVQPAESKGQMK